MNIDEIFEELYNSLYKELPKNALSLIIKYDIRVENFFVVYILNFLENLKLEKKIIGFTPQQHVPKAKEESDRSHIDLILTDILSIKYYIEIKHFSISKKKTTRSLSFYTADSKQGKKVGILGDVEKLQKIKQSGVMPDMRNLICLAIVTEKPSEGDFEQMKLRLKNYSQMIGWKLNLPTPFNKQNENIAMFYLTRNYAG